MGNTAVLKIDANAAIKDSLREDSRSSYRQRHERWPYSMVKETENWDWSQEIIVIVLD